MVVKFYAVVDSNGELRRPYQGRVVRCLYDTLTAAKRAARADGDSVVEVDVSLDKPPLFIRGQRVVPAE